MLCRLKQICFKVCLKEGKNHLIFLLPSIANAIGTRRATPGTFLNTTSVVVSVIVLSDVVTNVTTDVVVLNRVVVIVVSSLVIFVTVVVMTVGT